MNTLEALLLHPSEHDIECECDRCVEQADRLARLERETRPAGLTEREQAAAYRWLRDQALDRAQLAPMVVLADGNGDMLREVAGDELDAWMREVLR